MCFTVIRKVFTLVHCGVYNNSKRSMKELVVVECSRDQYLSTRKVGIFEVENYFKINILTSRTLVSVAQNNHETLLRLPALSPALKFISVKVQTKSSTWRSNVAHLRIDTSNKTCNEKDLNGRFLRTLSTWRVTETFIIRFEGGEMFAKHKEINSTTLRGSDRFMWLTSLGNFTDSKFVKVTKSW